MLQVQQPPLDEELDEDATQVPSKNMLEPKHLGYAIPPLFMQTGAYPCWQVNVDPLQQVGFPEEQVIEHVSPLEDELEVLVEVQTWLFAQNLPLVQSAEVQQFPGVQALLHSMHPLGQEQELFEQI